MKVKVVQNTEYNSNRNEETPTRVPVGSSVVSRHGCKLVTSMEGGGGGTGDHRNEDGSSNSVKQSNGGSGSDRA